MATQLPTGSGTSGPPSIKLPTIGNSVTFAVIDANPNVPDREFGTGNDKLNRYGKPKMQTVLTVLVTASDGAVTGETVPVEVGSVGSIFVNSYAKFDPDQDKLGGTHISFGGACDKLEGGLAVGDVGQWKYLQDLPSKAASPRKDRKFAFRKPKPEEGAQTLRCEALRAELAGNVLVGAPPAAEDVF